MTIDTADTVKHGPTGETWLVAFVEGKRLWYCGWPEGYADIDDCELVEKATPERKADLIKEFASAPRGGDQRVAWARRQLEQAP